MSKSTDIRLEALLREAESSGRCCAPLSKKDRIAFVRRVQANKGVVSPFPGLFSSQAYWNTLKWPIDKARSIIGGLSVLHPDWTFSHVSAAIVHGLEVSGDSPITIHVVSDVKGKKAGPHLARHVLSCPELKKSICLDGINVTPLWKTVFDCLCILPAAEALGVADSALRKTGRDAKWLVGYLQRKFKHHNGLKQAIRVARFADGRSENGGESYARAMIIHSGYEVPDLQSWFTDPVDSSHSYRVDFAWWDSFGAPRLIGELDGHCKTEDERCLAGQTPTRVLADERRRESHISAIGAPIMRFDFSEAKNPDLMKRLLEAFSAPLRPPGPARTHFHREVLGAWALMVSEYLLEPRRLYPSEVVRIGRTATT